MVSVDEIEIQTGIDFFSKLDDELAADLQSQLNTQVWNWGATPKKNSSSGLKEPVEQCQATTASGKQCSRKASEGQY